MLIKFNSRPEDVGRSIGFTKRKPDTAAEAAPDPVAMTPHSGTAHEGIAAAVWPRHAWRGGP